MVAVTMMIIVIARLRITVGNKIKTLVTYIAIEYICQCHIGKEFMLMKYIALEYICL